MKSKKGFQITEVPTLVVVLIVISILLGIAATILTSVRDGNEGRTSATDFYVNSTFVADNVTAVDFTPASLSTDGSGKDYFVPSSCTDVVLTNASLVDVTGNFTISGCTALLTGSNEAGFNATNIKANFTYSHYVYSVSYNISNTGLESQSDLSGWQSTWVVIIAAAVVIGIVSRYLFFKM